MPLLAVICLAFPGGAVGTALAPAEAEMPGDELAGLPMVAVGVEGAVRLSRDTVLFYLGLELGAAFDPAGLDRGIHRLWERGLVEDVAVEALPEGDGVRLLVRIVERPVVSSLEVRGLERVAEREITERLAGEGVAVTPGEPLRRSELAALEAAIEGLYRERGFALAEAVAAFEERAGGGVAVVVTVDEGERLRIGEVRFEGNEAFPDRRLRRALEESRAGGWIDGRVTPGRFDRAALARDLERVRELYRRAGYKDATLGEPRIEAEEGSGRRVTITVPVEEGERWKLGGVGFTGNRELSDSRLLALFDRPASGWLESERIEEGVERVRERYASQGFLTASVEPVVIERPGRTADLVVRIDEGERYRVGRIEVEGNRDTRDEVIRRELAVQEGEVLDAAALRRSLLRLGQLEVFELDDEEPVRFELDEERRRVDLTLRGREADPRRLFFGGGWGRTHGPFGEARYRSRNFRGLGHSLSAHLQAGDDLVLAELGYSVPWLLDRRQSLGGDLFVRDETFDAGGGESLRRDLSGGRLRWGRRLGLFQTVVLGYSYRDVVDSRSRLTASGQSVFQALDREVASLELSYALDRLDSRFQPTRGLRLAGSLESAGGTLGGDARYLRARLAADGFRPLGGGREPRLILGLHLEAGAIRATGGSTLAFNDRFFRGGDGSLRGFEPLAIHPRDASGAPLLDEEGFLLGGDRFLEAGVELHLPLDDRLRLVLFSDAGDVWAEGQAIDLGGLRWSAGLELRVTTPLFPQPLRFIWAENLSPLAGDRFENLQFSFGVGF